LLSRQIDNFPSSCFYILAATLQTGVLPETAGSVRRLTDVFQTFIDVERAAAHAAFHGSTIDLGSDDPQYLGRQYSWMAANEVRRIKL
jgi:hypothetical protein